MLALMEHPAALFLYGTLMRGQSHHHLLAGQTFISNAETVPAYRLLRVASWYPGLIACAEGAGVSVRGELWQVDAACLTRLDEFEDVNAGLYRRQPVRLQLPADWRARAVQTYLYQGDRAGCADCGRAWLGR